MKHSHKTVFLWVLLILMFVSIWQLFSQTTTTAVEKPINEFMQLVNEGTVKAVRVKGREFLGYTQTKIDGRPSYRAFGPMSENFHEKLLDKNIKVVYEKEEQSSFWQSVIIYWLPMILLFLIFFFFIRQMQVGGGKAMSFGKSKAKLLNENQKKITFADVAGIDEAKDELEEIIAFLKDPKKFTKLGGRIPKGVLLMGPPGTGKTLLARAIAGEAGVPFFSISGSDFVEMFVGVGASRVRDLFEQGKKHAPCIIFIDEIDAVGRHRGTGLGGGHDEREQTLNQLLVEMDGFESNEGVILIAATNRPDVLDPALLRPGRFDRSVVVARPDVKGREGILKVHTKKTPLSEDVDLQVIARGSPGFSGADLENLVNEAALLAARLNKDRINMADFEIAKDKVLMGTERRSLVMSEREKRSTAYHEAGHTLVAKLVPGCDPVHKVSIIPRGRALGLTQQLPSEDRHNISKDFAQNQVAVALGGRIAEELVFGEQTTGAGNDFEMATEMARRMVCEWGMSDRVGPLTVGKREEHPFLGREVAMPKTFSEQTAQLIDSEVRRIVMEQYERARTLIQDNMELLKRVAETLLEFESLDGEEINMLMRGETPVRKIAATVKSANGATTSASPGIIGVTPSPKGQPTS
ncbi:MAG: ATP-dependent metallopeptidase FtsH/Yme1/Tma family protein [Deltaproteobacteria bacterium]|nr:ATP-dependent metallopeptidase FtsH/Yme1/Tma family protein [Deltaproteobacteria bacterium]